MTPAQQVAIDAMRDAWNEETVQRMLRAEDGRIEEALIFELTDVPREERSRLIARRFDTVIWLRSLLRLSHAETPPGASTPHPAEETEQRGGLTVRKGAPVCSHCRDTSARLDCRACGGSGLANLDDVRPDAP